MDSELPADVARCQGADAVWCDHCRRREPSSHPMQAWMDAPSCVDVRGCAWHIPHGYREPAPVDFMGGEGGWPASHYRTRGNGYGAYATFLPEWHLGAGTVSAGLPGYTSLP